MGFCDGPEVGAQVGETHALDQAFAGDRAPAQAQETKVTVISTSYLCPHIEGAKPGFMDWLWSLPVKPRMVKSFSTDVARSVKGIDPRITTVVRHYIEGQTGYEHVNQIADLGGVDVLEGKNECFGFDDEQGARAANEWHLQFVEACVARGVKPCVLNIAVGNPREDIVKYVRPCVQAATAAGGYVGYHSYGSAIILYAEEFYAMRGPLKLAGLLGVSGVRWLHTEGTFDGVSIPDVVSGGWRSLLGKKLPNGDTITEPYIQSQLEIYNTRLGAFGIPTAMFTFYGTDQWAKYEYTASRTMMEWYAAHLAAHVEPPAPPIPTSGIVATSAYIREQAQEYPRIGVLYTGTKVEILGESGEYYHIGATGYIPKKLVRTT